MPAQRIVLLGSGDLSEEVRQALDALEAEVIRLPEPTDREVARMIDGVDRVVIVSPDDAFVVRMALMVRYADADVPMLVTAFDETTASQLERLGSTEVTSMADIVAPSLAGPCLGDDLAAVRIGDDGHAVGLRTTGDGVEEIEIEVPRRRRARAALRALLRPYDKSAALLLVGASGLAACLAVETIGAMIVLGQGFVDAFYGAAKTLVTVDPNDEVADGPAAFKLFISATMLTALLFEALFTAGIVNRLIDRRLTGIVGRNAVPRRDHVVVVGMGQVGLRLCLLLRRCGIGVVAVDDREEGENVGTAKELGLPVVVGRGADPSLLQRLSLDRAVALAAVTQDDLQNVAIAMAARSINDDLRIVLRAGDGQLANETRSLFRLGLVRDVHRIAAALLAAKATGTSAASVICHEDDAQLLHEDGRVEKAAITAAA